jgi:dephospho-CoA kinase
MIDISAFNGKQHPVIIGLLGGVASGKSLVAKYLEELGAPRLDADRVGHDVLRLPDVEAAIRARWGDGVFGPDDRVNRATVAKIVFAPTDEGRRELEFLEKLTHPRIGVRLRDEAERLAAAGHRYLVLDAPVMLKAGWDELCTKILYIDAPPEVRLQRALGRGWTAAEFAAREAAQESTETKRNRADFVLDNAGNPDVTRSQVKHWWQEFTGLVE